MQRLTFLFLTLFVIFANCANPEPGDIRAYVVQTAKDHSLYECKANLDNFIQVAQENFWNQSKSALIARNGIDFSKVDSAKFLKDQYYDIAAEISVIAFPRQRPVIRGYVVVSTDNQDLARMSTQDKLNYLRTTKQVVYDKIDEEYRRICK